MRFACLLRMMQYTTDIFYNPTFALQNLINDFALNPQESQIPSFFDILLSYHHRNFMKKGFDDDN